MPPNQIQQITSPKPKKFIIISGVMAVIILVIVFVIVFSGSQKQQSTPHVNPATTKLQACLKDKNVSSDDWAAYQKAAMDCQTK